MLFVNLLYLEYESSSQDFQVRYSISPCNTQLFETFQLSEMNTTISNLRDTILDLEVENLESVKDASMLENRLLKYQCHLSFQDEVVASLCYSSAFT